MNLFTYHSEPRSLEFFMESHQCVPDLFFVPNFSSVLDFRSDDMSNVPQDPSSIFAFRPSNLKMLHPLRVREPAIALSAKFSVRYATHILKGRFPAGEKAIAESPVFSRIYAEDVIGGVWPEGEAAIARDAEQSLLYAEYVTRRRFPAGEPAIRALMEELSKPSAGGYGGASELFACREYFRRFLGFLS